MRFRIFFVLFGLSLFSSCSAAPPKRGETAGKPLDKNADASEAEDSDESEKKVVIIENPSLEIAVEAQLKHKYRLMGLEKEFAGRLVEMHLDLNLPEQFELVLGEQNPVWKYDFALRSKSGKSEIRFRVVREDESPLPEVPGDEKLAERKAVSNELMRILMILNGGSLVADLQPHPEAMAKSRFNAGNYSTATFRPVSEFADFEIGSAGVFYRSGFGMVVVVSLFNELNDPETRTEWTTGANALRFALEPADETSKF